MDQWFGADIWCGKYILGFSEKAAKCYFACRNILGQGGLEVENGCLLCNLVFDSLLLKNLRHEFILD